MALTPEAGEGWALRCPNCKVTNKKRLAKMTCHTIELGVVNWCYRPGMEIGDIFDRVNANGIRKVVARDEETPENLEKLVERTHNMNDKEIVLVVHNAGNGSHLKYLDLEEKLKKDGLKTKIRWVFK